MYGIPYMYAHTITKILSIKKKKEKIKDNKKKQNYDNSKILANGFITNGIQFSRALSYGGLYKIQTEYTGIFRREYIQYVHFTDAYTENVIYQYTYTIFSNEYICTEKMLRIDIYCIYSHTIYNINGIK